MGDRDRRASRLFGTAAVLLLILAVFVGCNRIPAAGWGEIDPASAVIALVSLVVSGWCGWRSLVLARLAQRWNDTDVEGLATRLALAVDHEERVAWQQLLSRTTTAVDISFRTLTRARTTPPARSVGTLSDVLAFYRALDRPRLVITGVGGSGKTVLALELMLGLLGNRTAGQPVPLRLSAATWPGGQTIEDWLIEYLTSAYGLATAAAHTLVRAHMILPVVDGVDEMDADSVLEFSSRAAELVKALNDYQGSRAAAALVVTGRTGQLSALETLKVRLHGATTIEIDAVPVAKADEFLRANVVDAARWRPVLRRIRDQPNGPLAKALSTPWRLTLAKTVYEQRHGDSGAFVREPSVLVSIASSADPVRAADPVRDHLLSLLIPAVTTADSSFRPEDVHRWLAVLVRDYLNHPAGMTAPGVPFSGTDLVLHRLWPMAGVRRIRATATLCTCLLICAAMAGELSRTSSTLLNPVMIFTVSLLAAMPLSAVILMSSLSRVEPYRFTWQLGRRTRGRDAVRLIAAVSVLAASVAGVGYAAVAIAARNAPGWVMWAIPVCALVFGLFALSRDRAVVSARHPRELLVSDIRFVLLLAIATGAFTTVLMIVYPPPLPQASFGYILGPVFGFVIACTLAPASLYYLSLLLLSRRWSRHPLPWQLGQFLDWCRAQGLLRTAGIAYQFRHREIQDYLARNPVPTS